MRAAVTTASGRVEVVEMPAPEPGPGQMRLRVQACGICGSDLHALTEYDPGMVMGHEFVGTVESLGAGVTEFAVGDRVASLPILGCQTCAECLTGDPVNCTAARLLGFDRELGGFADMVLADAMSSVRLPAELTLAQAGVIEPLAIALKVVERANLRSGDRLLVMGGGPIGAAVAAWAHTNGVSTIVVTDPIADRRRIAEQMGATHTVDPLTTDMAAYFEQEIGGAPDVVIECVGRPGSFAEATRYVRRAGTVVVAGFHMTTEEFERSTPFLKNLNVQFCCWYSVSHYRHTVAMLASGRLDPSPMVTHQVRLDDLDDVLASLRNPNGFGKVLVVSEPAE